MIETIIVMLIVSWSVWVTLQRFFPVFVAKQQQGLAAIVALKGWTSLAKWLEPAMSSGGCGSGCQSCPSRCAAPNADESEQVVRWPQP